MNNKTLNEIVDIFRSISTRHEQLNDFGFGPISSINTSNEMKTPYLWLSVIDGSTINSSDGGYLSIDMNLNLRIVDLISNVVNDSNNGEETTNGLEVSSDTLQVLNDIVSEFSKHPYYVSKNIKLKNDISFNPLYDYDISGVNGWDIDITIRMPFRLTYCDTPSSTLDYTSLIPSTTEGNVQGLCEAIADCQLIIDLQNHPGLTGATGAIGATGATGATGAIGATGASENLNLYVPYTGATTNVDLGTYNIITGNLNINNISSTTASESISNIVINTNGDIKSDDFFYIGVNFKSVETFYYVAPEDFRINSVDNPSSLTITYLVNGSPYTLGNTISQYDELQVDVTTIGYIKLNTEWL